MPQSAYPTLKRTSTTRYPRSNRHLDFFPPSAQPPLGIHDNTNPIPLLPSFPADMAVEQEHFVHLSRPLAPAALGYSASSAPLTVNIQPQVRPF